MIEYHDKNVDQPQEVKPVAMETEQEVKPVAMEQEIKPIESQEPQQEPVQEPVAMETEQQPENKKDEASLHKILAKEIILTFLPKKYKDKADILLKLIEKNSVLDWNAKGQLLVNGKAVPYSHIADLLRDSVIPHHPFKPQGYKEFYKYLERVPRYLISLGRRALLGGGVEEAAGGGLIANWKCLPTQTMLKKQKKNI